MFSKIFEYIFKGIISVIILSFSIKILFVAVPIFIDRFTNIFNILR
ncbi:hypothetical protein [Clostridium botulinum]|nr:hypothetical protein [Clostridium botulinum]